MTSALESHDKHTDGQKEPVVHRSQGDAAEGPGLSPDVLFCDKRHPLYRKHFSQVSVADDQFTP